MFYFGAHAGDTILLYNDSTRYFDGIRDGAEYLHGIVDSIVTEPFTGQSLKRFYVSILDTAINSHRRFMSYSEKTGYTYNNGFVFYPSYEYFLDGFPNILCNYGDSTLSNYWLNPANQCNAQLGIDDPISKAIRLNIFPNPSSGSFTIDMSGLGSSVRAIHIYNQLGQVVYTGETDRSELALDLHLVSGMYAVRVSESTRSCRGKIVVQ
jgi:hypothetical protein